MSKKNLLLILFFLQENLYAATSSDNFFWTKFFVGFVVMGLTYFILKLPEKREIAAFKKMIKALKKGDTVLTSAGIVGTILSIEGRFMTLKFPSGYSIVIIKESVTALISKEEFSSSKGKII